MIRKLATVLGVVCVATVFTMIFAVGLLWYRGQLTPEVIEAIGTMIVDGEELESMTNPEESDVRAPSAEEIVNKRVQQLLDIEDREKEVDLLLGMVNTRADELEERQRELAARTKAFDERRKTLETQWQSEATTQARAVLKAQQPGDAMRSLGTLELEEAVLLVRGLPEKSIARILQEFSKANDEKEIRRGREIFEAITHGEPQRSLLNETVPTGVEDDAVR